MNLIILIRERGLIGLVALPTCLMFGHDWDKKGHLSACKRCYEFKCKGKPSWLP